MAAYHVQDRIEAQSESAHQSTIARDKWIDGRAKEIIGIFPEDPNLLVAFSKPRRELDPSAFRHEASIEAYNDYVSAVAYAQAEYEWSHLTGCPF